jgi:hypothetical protein
MNCGRWFAAFFECAINLEGYLGLVPLVFATMQHFPSEGKISASLNAGNGHHEIGLAFLCLSNDVYTKRALLNAEGTLSYEIPVVSSLRNNKYPGLPRKIFEGRHEVKITSLKVVTNFWYERGVGVASGLLDQLAMCLSDSYFFVCPFFPVFDEYGRCDADEGVWQMCVEFAVRFQMKVGILDAEHGLWFIRRATSLRQIGVLPKSTLLVFIASSSETEASGSSQNSHQPVTNLAQQDKHLPPPQYLGVPTYDPAQLRTWEPDCVS